MKNIELSKFLLAIASVMAFLIFPCRVGLAHAVLLEATPAADSAVAGPDVAVKLRFNVRVDRSRSRLTLTLVDGKMTTLKIAAADAPDTISARVSGLSPGTYHLHWQVLAADGHITRGDIPFHVSGTKN